MNPLWNFNSQFSISPEWEVHQGSNPWATLTPEKLVTSGSHGTPVGQNESCNSFMGRANWPGISELSSVCLHEIPSDGTSVQNLTFPRSEETFGLDNDSDGRNQRIHAFQGSHSQNVSMGHSGSLQDILELGYFGEVPPYSNLMPKLSNIQQHQETFASGLSSLGGDCHYTIPTISSALNEVEKLNQAWIEIDKLDGSSSDELLQNIVDSFRRKEATVRGNSEGIDLNRTPQERLSQRQKRKPKGVVEGRAKKAKIFPIPEESEITYGNHSGERICLHSGNGTPSQEIDGKRDNEKNMGAACKRALNFDLEQSAEKQNLNLSSLLQYQKGSMHGTTISIDATQWLGASSSHPKQQHKQQGNIRLPLSVPFSKDCFSATPDLAQLESQQVSMIPNFLVEETVNPGKEQDKLDNSNQDELSLSAVDSLKSKVLSASESHEGVNPNRTPQKRPSRKKHRPKVIVEGKRKKTNKSSNPEKSNAEDKNPSGKNVRRKGMKGTMGQQTDVEKDIGENSNVDSVKSCRRTLNFDLEGSKSASRILGLQDISFPVPPVEESLMRSTGLETEVLDLNCLAVSDSCTGLSFRAMEIPNLNNILELSPLNKDIQFPIPDPPRVSCEVERPDQALLEKDKDESASVELIQSIVNTSRLKELTVKGNDGEIEPNKAEQQRSLERKIDTVAVEGKSNRSKKSPNPNKSIVAGKVPLAKSRYTRKKGVKANRKKDLKENKDSTSLKLCRRETVVEKQNVTGSVAPMEETLQRNTGAEKEPLDLNFPAVPNSWEDISFRTASNPNQTVFQASSCLSTDFRSAETQNEAQNRINYLGEETINLYNEKHSLCNSNLEGVLQNIAEFCKSKEVTDKLCNGGVDLNTIPQNRPDKRKKRGTKVIVKGKREKAKTSPTSDSLNVTRKNKCVGRQHLNEMPSRQADGKASGEYKEGDCVSSCRSALNFDLEEAVGANIINKTNIDLNSTPHTTELFIRKIIPPIQDQQGFQGINLEISAEHPGPSAGLKQMDAVNEIINGLRALDLNVDACAIVPYEGEGTLVPYEKKKSKQRPRVDLDPETNRIWNLLMGKDRSDGFEENNLEKEKQWQAEREIFRARVDSFIARMHLIQGDRRFSPWKGSVVDSVIGVYLTQNVSDHLSSSAFMSLAARFPVNSTGHSRHCDKGKAKILVEEPEDIVAEAKGLLAKLQFVSCQSSVTLHPLRECWSDRASSSALRTKAIEAENHITEEFLSSQGSSDTQVKDLGVRGVQSSTLKSLCMDRFISQNQVCEDGCAQSNYERCEYNSLWHGVDFTNGFSANSYPSYFENQNVHFPSVPFNLHHFSINSRTSQQRLEDCHVFGEENMSSPSMTFGITGESVATSTVELTTEMGKSQEPQQNCSSTGCHSATKSILTGIADEMNAKNVKAKGRKTRMEKKVNWDTLRMDAQAEAGWKERGEDAMDSLDYDALRKASIKEISDTIKERGMNNMLAERIKDFLNRLVEEHGSTDLEWLRDVPPDKAKDYLLSIRGLGIKSVECVRLLTLHHSAFPVDTNVGRVAVRLGWVPLEPLPEALQLHLLELYPMLESIQKYLWPRLCKLDQRTLYELHYQLITFGKVFCTKTKPNCNACPMRGDCRHFASAFASARLALPSPDENKTVTTMVPLLESDTSIHINEVALHHLENSRAAEPESENNGCLPIIEEPASPKEERRGVLECDIEETWFVDDGEYEIPTINLNINEFTEKVQKFIQQFNVELPEADMSKALVALDPGAASIPTRKLKNVSRLRTEHQVYELPDDHPLLEGMQNREPDDPCPYLLAIWTAGETADSVEPPREMCESHDSGNFCSEETCFRCNSMKESNAQTVRGTILTPCRTAMRGSFPLNGTYFQVNEMFADHKTSVDPIHVQRDLIWNLRRRIVYFGTSVTAIFRGLTTEDIQRCFWRGFVCVRGFDGETRSPRPLVARLHFPARKQTRRKNEERRK